MEQFETRFSQVDVLPMVKHYMDELDLVNLFTRYVPAAPGSLADHAESLCVLTANIICDNKPLYKVQEWLGKYSDDLGKEPIEAVLFNDDRLARSLSALFEADRHSLMAEVSGNAIATHNLLTDEVHNDSTLGDLHRQIQYTRSSSSQTQAWPQQGFQAGLQTGCIWFEYHLRWPCATELQAF